MSRIRTYVRAVTCGSRSEHNTLVVMTVVAAIFVPFVLLYQGWTYWVFRRRLTRPPEARAARPAAGPGGPARAAAVTPAGNGSETIATGSQPTAQHA